MIIVLGDLIADFSLRIPSFPVEAGNMQRVEYLELGPGGATNVAISASRLGLSVGCLGEVGSDQFGEIVLEGLRAESVEISGIRVVPSGETPVAGVLVDAQGEPAYLGYPGTLCLDTLPEAWRQTIARAEALFVDGWADHPGTQAVILAAVRTAREASVPSFFDPGPGNPALDNDWHLAAAAVATVLIATEDEARRLTGLADPAASAEALLKQGPEMVVLKRGVAGCVLLRGGEIHIAPGMPVEALDATGAGDSLDAAVIYGFLKGLSLEDMGTLANATGAAKVRKAGTGHNMPTLDEIRSVLERFGRHPADLLG
jgi:5-dehydro-2-deoxygluconokinase